MVSEAVGLGDALQQSNDYIQLYSGSKELLIKSFERIQKTASMLMIELGEIELSHAR